MKKLIIALALVGCLAQSAWATITITAVPSAQTVAAGGTFNVTFSLSVTQNTAPANVSGVDLFIEAAKMQNSIDITNLFAITVQAPASGWLAAGGGSYPDALGANGTHSGFVQALGDQAVTHSPALVTPLNNVVFETLTFSVAANTPNGVYNFDTTLPTSTTDARGSHITDSSATYFIPNTEATFSITVVPEPATLSLLGLGGLGSLGLSLLRRRRLNG